MKDYKKFSPFYFLVLGMILSVGLVGFLAFKNKNRLKQDIQKNNQSFFSNEYQSKPSSFKPDDFSEDEEVIEVIKRFVFLVHEGRADEASKMMKVEDTSPEQINSELQVWAVHFAAIKSFKILKLERVNEEEWTQTKHIYKVVLDVLMDPSSADAPIPYYGWQNGENTRWFVLEKIDNVWKIASIATGP